MFNKSLNQELKDTVKKENLSSPSTCVVDTDVKAGEPTPITTEAEKQIKNRSLERKLQLENDRLMIENASLMSDNTLKMLFSIFIITLLSIQTVVIFVILILLRHHFDKIGFATLVGSIVGQSYFLPSFLAKYLFKNDGVKLK